MSDPIIRLLAFDDLDEALTLSATAGWNQRLDDWRMLLRLAPTGAFAAVSDARIVGTAIGIDYGPFAWIAMMLVNPAYRGRGVGRRLLEVAIDAVPSKLPIRLDATPLGRPLYQRYGFEDEAMLSRHVADGSTRGVASASATVESSRDVRPLTASDLKIVVERDTDTFGGLRGAVLEWAFHDAANYAHVVRSRDGLTHYCLGRPGRLFDQIGPVVAGHEDIALALLSAALVAAGDRPVAVDAFDSRTAFTAGLRSRGFHVHRPLVRMRRPAGAEASATLRPGQGPQAQGRPEPRRRSTGALPHGPLVEFAILGPEFG
jgi:GNAT superfamily N-acetyltransferase